MSLLTSCYPGHSVSYAKIGLNISLFHLSGVCLINTCTGGCVDFVIVVVIPAAAAAGAAAAGAAIKCGIPQCQDYFLLLYPGIQFSLTCTPRTICYGCQIVHRDPLNTKQSCPQIINWCGPCENIRFPWQPVIWFSRM